MKHVTVIGIQGVPAQYGGFESLVENLIGDNKSPDVKYTIFCSGKDMPVKVSGYKGAELKYIPLNANGIQSIPYDIISLFMIPRNTDAILVLGVSGCIILPLFRLFCRKKLIINKDGLEHRRKKWGKLARAFLRLSEKMAVKHADVLISDNVGIRDYVMEEYGRESTIIAYGGDQAIVSLSAGKEEEIMRNLSLTPGKYAAAVCRIEPENNTHLILKVFAASGKGLAMVGNWENSEYGRNLKREYSSFANIHIIDMTYDREVLYALRKNAFAYVHGHSAGGTNPSLVEAMFFGMPVLAYDVVYNRETTGGKAVYWRTEEDLQALLESVPSDGKVLQKMAGEFYSWSLITRQYENLY